MVRFFLLLLVMQIAEAKAASYTAVLSGNWNSATTWAPSGVPGAGDNVTISLGIAVTLTADAQCSNLSLTAPLINGTSVLNVGNFNLTVSNAITLGGGTNNNRIARITIQNGSVYVSGDITFNASNSARAEIDMSSGSGFFYLTGDIVLSSRGSLNAGTSSTFVYSGSNQDVGGFTYNNLTLTNSGTKTFLGNAALNGTFSIEGTASVSLSPRTITYAASSALQYKSSSAQTTGAEFSASSIPPALIIDNTNSSGVTLAASGLTINSLSLVNGPFKLNGKVLTVNTQSPTAISRISGYIESETAAAVPGGGTSPAGPGHGLLIWNIGSVAGNYVFPFATSAGVYIPMTVALNSGDAGLVTAATYKTATDNTPYPEVVTHVFDNTGTGTDNSINTVDRFWVLASTGLSADLNLTFSYAQLSERPAAGSEADVYAQAWSLGSWSAALPGQSRALGAETAASISSVTVPAVTLPLGVWSIAKGITPLPIALLSFTGTLSGSGTFLRWSTATEINVDYYTLEKSMDGKNFREIGKVISNNIISKRQDYSFLDESTGGSAYYRLKEHDIDGLVTVFDPIFIQGSTGIAGNIRISNSLLEFRYTGEISGQIFYVSDLSGREVLKGRVTGPSFQVSIGDLAPGVYILNVLSREYGILHSGKFSKR